MELSNNQCFEADSEVLFYCHGVVGVKYFSLGNSMRIDVIYSCDFPVLEIFNYASNQCPDVFVGTLLRLGIMESFRSKMSQLCSAAEVKGGLFLLVCFLEDLCRGELNL